MTVATHIVGAGARTPLGLTAATSAAAVRGGISRIREHSTLVDHGGEFMRGAFDGVLEATLPCRDRMVALVESALDELADSLPAAGQRELVLLLAMPELRPGWTQPDEAFVIGAIRRMGRARGWVIKPTVPARGHAGAVHALMLGHQLVSNGREELCLVGGVESFFAPSTLAWLAENRQLAGEDVRSGFFPGEAACVLGLASASVTRELRVRSRGVVLGAHSGAERRTLASGEEVLGDGLTDAILNATGALRSEERVVTQTYLRSQRRALSGGRVGVRRPADELLLSRPHDDPGGACRSMGRRRGRLRDAARDARHLGVGAGVCGRTSGDGVWRVRVRAAQCGGPRGAAQRRRGAMGKVAVNPPKTPVTKGSNGTAIATVPNVCKMPGPPAPFVPAPLPNIGRSSDSPKGYSKKVKFEKKPVAIKGATFKSKGDVASKGTGGGLVSANTHGITKFVGLGSMDVKVEGKNVQLLGDQMLNNCGGSGNPPNAATLMGVAQGPGAPAPPTPCNPHVVGGEPCCPPTDEEFRERRNKLARNKTAGGRHEHAAARHNEKGIIRAEGSLKRETGEDRTALSTGDDEQVTHSCAVCGAPMPGEIEHVSEDRDGKKNAVEAKSGEDFHPAKDAAETARNTRQMARNVALAQNTGMGVIYKIPKGHDKAERQIKALAEASGMPAGALRVLQI